MKKIVSFLALLLIVSVGGCNNDEKLIDTITSGTWRVDYFLEDNDERTSLFDGYVFTFLPDGSVTVTRAGTPPPPGTWDESDNGWRLEFDFGNEQPLEKLNENWVVDLILDDEVLLHDSSAPLTQLRLQQL